MSSLNLDESRNEILGMLDELNSFIGFAKCFTDNKKFISILTAIQNDLFLIQAEIADPAPILYKPRRISQDHVRYIEITTSLIEKRLKEISHFIVSEGTKFASVLHCIRTIRRRAESEMVNYGPRQETEIVNSSRASHEGLRELSLAVDLHTRYLDRVACLVFAMARLENRRRNRRERKPDYYSDDYELKKEDEGRKR